MKFYLENIIMLPLYLYFLLLLQWIGSPLQTSSLALHICINPSDAPAAATNYIQSYAEDCHHIQRFSFSYSSILLNQALIILSLNYLSISEIGGYIGYPLFLHSAFLCVNIKGIVCNFLTSERQIGNYFKGSFQKLQTKHYLKRQDDIILKHDT